MVKLYNLNAENMGACTCEFVDAHTIIRHKVRNIIVFRISKENVCNLTDFSIKDDHISKYYKYTQLPQNYDLCVHNS